MQEDGLFVAVEFIYLSSSTQPAQLAWRSSSQFQIPRRDSVIGPAGVKVHPCSSRL